MARLTIGVLHPGEMGGGIGGALVEGGHDSLWASAGRSAATRARAEAGGMRDCGSVAGVAEAADVIFSVCPPHAAIDVAREVGGFTGLYLDANAIAPATAAEVAAVIESGGGRYLDGGIVGGPPRPGRPTRIYLSGPGGEGLAADLVGSNLDCRVLSERPGDASALKMCYAAWTKGTSALLLGIRGVAQALDVDDALLAEWAGSQPELLERAFGAGGQAATKGWRWVGEMEEIAKTFEAVGLPGGFHEAAAEIYRRAPRDEEAAADAATLEAVLTSLVPSA